MSSLWGNHKGKYNNLLSPYSVIFMWKGNESLAIGPMAPLAALPSLCASVNLLWVIPASAVTEGKIQRTASRILFIEWIFPNSTCILKPLHLLKSCFQGSERKVSWKRYVIQTRKWQLEQKIYNCRLHPPPIEAEVHSVHTGRLWIQFMGQITANMRQKLPPQNILLVFPVTYNHYAMHFSSPIPWANQNYKLQ